MRLIDADEFFERLCDRDCDIVPQYLDDGYSIERIEETLDATPTVDAVPVVRCENCVYNTAKWLYNHGVNEPICRFSNYPHKADDFCSRGQTMTAEEEEAEYDELRYSWAREEYETPIY